MYTCMFLYVHMYVHVPIYAMYACIQVHNNVCIVWQCMEDIVPLICMHVALVCMREVFVIILARFLQYT